MPKESDMSPRRRFARDLRRIRKEREISIDEVRSDTQIRSAQLEAFEEGDLFAEASMNRVYLRAFIRTYARVIELPEEDVLGYFEAAMEGEYAGGLAQEYLGVPAPAVESDASSSSEDSEPEVGSETGEERRSEAEEETPPDEDAAGVDEEGHDYDRPSAGGGMPEQTAAGGESGDVDTAEDAATRSSLLRPRSVYEWFGAGSGSRDARPIRLWAGAGVLGILVIIVVLVLVSGGESDAPTESVNAKQEVTTREPSATTDSLEKDNVTDEVPPPAELTLTDTLHVTVVATAPVREMRVQRDDDLRRPYWIEVDEGTAFPFTRRITIEDELENARIYLEGYRFPESQTNQEGQIVIDRETAQAFADTLRGSPASLSVPVDTAAILQPPEDDAGG